MRIRIILASILMTAATAAVLDRIAVTVNYDAITEGEVIEEIRVTDFINNQPLDFSLEARRAAAERLVDQYLIRHEIEAGSTPQPDARQADKVLQDFIRAHYRSRAEFEAKLKQYGIAENQLKEHLLFQVAALQFTELRFNNTSANEADRAAPGADTKVDQQLDSWLKELRAQTRIEFKKEAFE